MGERDTNKSAYARISSADTGTEQNECFSVGPLDPCIIVVVGASGDLTARKLMPAFYSLFENGVMPDPFLIVGCSRTKMDDEEFRDKMKNAVMGQGKGGSGSWEKFAKSLRYRPIDYGERSDFEKLGRELKELDEKNNTEGNRIFYLSVPPFLYETVAEMIGKAGLARAGTDGSNRPRIVVEKPFGRDLESARGLDRTLHEHFREEQIFRIDHYLAKETVQNILMFRFANGIFESFWNRQHIDYVSITAAESVGVEHRGGYYEKSTILRDMFQNHMMQLLALTAMEPPAEFEANRVRDEKVKVFRALKPFPVEELQSHLVLGQYGPGTIDGRQLPGYREEPDVDSNSLTPTFAMMKVFLDNWRWKGVPFYLASGKRLAEKLTQIVIQFKEVPHSMFRQSLGADITPNRLTLGIYPDEKITLTFQTKRPGPRVCLRPVTMDFHYYEGYDGPSLEAYEKVLLDVMLGDHMLFWREDGVELCWAFLTPILETFEKSPDQEKMLRFYESGTWGPDAGDLRISS
jgi:glucose-6-phosphate 1-dehydrogenase